MQLFQVFGNLLPSTTTYIPNLSVKVCQIAYIGPKYCSLTATRDSGRGFNRNNYPMHTRTVP